MARHILTRVVAGLLLVAATACVTTSSKAMIEGGEAKLIPGTAELSGPLDIEVNGIVEAQGQRTQIKVYMMDCRAGNGPILIEDGSHARIPNAIAAGSNPADRIFAELCAEILKTRRR